MYFIYVLLIFVLSLSRKPPIPQVPQHRLNLSGVSGGGGPPRRKVSGYTRPQFTGPMELETLMEEGAVGGREGDAQTADDSTRAPLTNGDKVQQQPLDDQQSQKLQLPATMGSSHRPSSQFNLYLAACTGQYDNR